MNNPDLSKKSVLVFVVSNLWQSRIYKKVINQISDKSRPIVIIGLRSNINDKSYWSDINFNDIYHINISHIFNFSKLSFFNSILSISSIRRELSYFLSNLPKTIFKNGVTFITDDLFRVHELAALSLFKNITKIVCLQHGLRSKKNNIKNRTIEPLIKQLRFFLFCNIYRFLANDFRGISLKKKCIFLSIFDAKRQKNNKLICSGNLAVESSVIDLNELKKNNDKNFLFMGSGAFRYHNEKDKKFAYDAVLYAFQIYNLGGFKKLYFKFKPDEDIEFLKNKFSDDENIVFLAQNFDLLESIKASSPNLVMCSDGSTVVAELFLSGYKNILYKTNFVGYDNFYSDMYKSCGIKVQDLSSLKKEITNPTDPKIIKKLKNLIGYKNGGIKLVAEILE